MNKRILMNLAMVMLTTNLLINIHHLLALIAAILTISLWLVDFKFILNKKMQIIAIGFALISYLLFLPTKVINVFNYYEYYLAFIALNSYFLISFFFNHQKKLKAINKSICLMASIYLFLMILTLIFPNNLDDFNLFYNTKLVISGLISNLFCPYLIAYAFVSYMHALKLVNSQCAYMKAHSK